MRQTLLIGAVALLTLVGAPPGAQAGAWCSEEMSGSGDGATNCGFSSWEQCMETARGSGGYCTRNLWRDTAPTAAQPRSRKQAQKPPRS
jgi:hypothetical protein